jgi:hypothetical protein
MGLLKLNLNEVKPTEEELKQAREILAASTKEQKKSRTNSMLSWLKSNPCPEAVGSRDEERAQWLEKFVVVQIQSKNKTSGTVQQISGAKAKYTDFHWWSKETMQKNLGENKSQIWIDSNLLKNRPCVLTGLDTEWVREYRIPEGWERMSSEDLTQWVLKSEGQANEQDAKIMQEVAESFAFGAGSSQDHEKGADPIKDATPKIKVEPADKATADELMVKTFFLQIECKIEQVQQMEVDTKKMLGQRCELSTKQFKYTESLATDLQNHSSLLVRLQNIMKKCLVAKPEEHKMPVLVKHFEGLVASHSQLKDVGAKFGLITAKVSKRKAKQQQSA